MMVVPARGELDRLQFEAGDAGSDVQSGLALHAERLQRVGVGGTADEEIAAAADADRRVGADAAIAAGEFAAPEPGIRCIDSPGQLGLRGDAEVETDALHFGEIGFRPAAIAAEHALETGHRADHEADILAALALQDAGANHRRRRAGACKRRHQRERGKCQCQESHVSQSPHVDEQIQRGGQDGSAVSKTWRFPKKHGALERSDQNIARFMRT